MTPSAKGLTAVMARRREPPDALDYFPTPPWATRALFRHVLPALGIEATGHVWEPACGEGHMAAVIAESARGTVLASDIYAYGYGTAPHDFLYDDPLTTPDWIITNPPFSIACEFTLRALQLASSGVAMLVRTQWIEGIGRYAATLFPVFMLLGGSVTSRRVHETLLVTGALLLSLLSALFTTWHPVY